MNSFPEKEKERGYVGAARGKIHNPIFANCFLKQLRGASIQKKTSCHDIRRLSEQAVPYIFPVPPSVSYSNLLHPSPFLSSLTLWFP